jgi:hypothetical protein
MERRGERREERGERREEKGTIPDADLERFNEV